jgi:mediator of RNA polymerase II transcription subunit 10
VQTLYTLLVQLHSFRGPETTSALHTTLTTLLSNLSTLLATAPSLSTIAVPREIIAYVEDGRNPDIYTREFVEIVQRQNQFVRGKAEAFASFRDVLAEEIGSALPALRGDVERVLAATGGGDATGASVVKVEAAAGAAGTGAGAGAGAAGTGPRMNDLR